MDSSERGALGLVRLVAGCIILAGVLDGGLYLTQYFSHLAPHQTRLPLNIFRLVLDSLPIIIGIVMLIKAKAIAEWLADMIQ
jgi:hypothetical protein